MNNLTFQSVRPDYYLVSVVWVYAGVNSVIPFRIIIPRITGSGGIYRDYNGYGRSDDQAEPAEVDHCAGYTDRPGTSVTGMATA